MGEMGKQAGKEGWSGDRTREAGWESGRGEGDGVRKFFREKLRGVGGLVSAVYF